MARSLGTGAIWVPASAAARPVLEKSAKDLGVTVHAVAKAPTGDAMKLKPIRIGLYDQYGGSMPSGWTRWLFEQYEFPFEVVYPATPRCGRSEEQVRRAGLHRRRDPPRRRGRTRRRRRRFRRARSGDHSGRISADGSAASPTRRRMPQLKKFVESGGSIVTIGSSTSIAEVFGIPVKNHLVGKGTGRQGPRAAGREVLHPRLAAQGSPG